MSDFKVFDENGKGYIGLWKNEGEGKAAYSGAKPVYIPAGEYFLDLFKNDKEGNEKRPDVKIRLNPVEPRQPKPEQGGNDLPQDDIPF